MRQATGLAKAPHVADFVRLLVESGERVILFGWHHAVYRIWEERLSDLGVAWYTGTESATKKDAEFSRFLRKEVPILVMSLRAGAGLDGLQHGCRTLVFGELDWSPAVLAQCEGRLHRDERQRLCPHATLR
jgi:SNF2 family DNA or RNA helicase